MGDLDLETEARLYARVTRLSLSLPRESWPGRLAEADYLAALAMDDRIFEAPDANTPLLIAIIRHCEVVDLPTVGSILIEGWMQRGASLEAAQQLMDAIEREPRLGVALGDVTLRRSLVDPAVADFMAAHVATVLDTPYFGL